MGTVVAVLLFVGAIVRPMVVSRPDLARATGPTPSPTPGVSISDPWDRGRNEQTEEALIAPTPTQTPTRSWPGLRLRESGVTVTTPTARSARSGPRELTLWDGSTVSVTPAELRSDEGGGYRWHLPRRGVGWHSNTPDCGRGVTVVGGHISYDGVPGALVDLTAIGPDDAVVCVDGGGERHRYVPQDYLVGTLADDVKDWYPDWGQALVLYTCTPDLNDRLLVVRFRPSGDG